MSKPKAPFGKAAAPGRLRPGSLLARRRRHASAEVVPAEEVVGLDADAIVAEPSAAPARAARIRVESPHRQETERFGKHRRRSRPAAVPARPLPCPRWRSPMGSRSRSFASGRENHHREARREIAVREIDTAITTQPPRSPQRLRARRTLCEFGAGIGVERIAGEDERGQVGR